MIQQKKPCREGGVLPWQSHKNKRDLKGTYVSWLILLGGHYGVWVLADRKPALDPALWGAGLYKPVMSSLK